MTAVTERVRSNRLVLSRAAKRIVVLFIVLGVLLPVAAITSGVLSGARSSNTAHKLDSDYADAASAFQTFGQQSRSCAGQLACLHEADASLAANLEGVRAHFDTLSFPASVSGEAKDFRADLVALIDVAHQLQAVAPDAYNRTLTQLQPLATRFDTAYQALREKLPA